MWETRRENTLSVFHIPLLLVPVFFRPEARDVGSEGLRTQCKSFQTGRAPLAGGKIRGSDVPGCWRRLGLLNGISLRHGALFSCVFILHGLFGFYFFRLLLYCYNMASASPDITPTLPVKRRRQQSPPSRSVPPSHRHCFPETLSTGLLTSPMANHGSKGITVQFSRLHSR